MWGEKVPILKKFCQDTPDCLLHPFRHDDVLESETALEVDYLQAHLMAPLLNFTRLWHQD